MQFQREREPPGTVYCSEGCSAEGCGLLCSQASGFLGLHLQVAELAGGAVEEAGLPLCAALRGFLYIGQGPGRVC